MQIFNLDYALNSHPIVSLVKQKSFGIRHEDLTIINSYNNKAYDHEKAGGYFYIVFSDY